MLKEQSLTNHQPSDGREPFEDFVYLVVHDLGPPLRRIDSFSELLEQEYAPLLDERGVHYVDCIAENSRQAQARLRGLLQYARLSAVPLAKSRIDCNRILHDALMQLKPEIDSRNARVHPGLLPRLEANGERLQLLFYCLLSNALKFCNETPDIAVSARRSLDGWLFEVHDNGIGIPRKDQETIFAIFRRLHRDGTYDGIGIGLALARRIVELHDGRIWVESELGCGSSFYFTLPDA